MTLAEPRARGSIAEPNAAPRTADIQRDLTVLHSAPVCFSNRRTPRSRARSPRRPLLDLRPLSGDGEDRSAESRRNLQSPRKGGKRAFTAAHEVVLVISSCPVSAPTSPASIACRSLRSCAGCVKRCLDGPVVVAVRV